MKRAPVESSNLSSVGYDSSSSTLDIEFQEGAVYQYYDVPESVFRGLMAAPSKGKYFHQHIRDRFSYKQL